jgi:hypothetical protein
LVFAALLCAALSQGNANPTSTPIGQRLRHNRRQHLVAAVLVLGGPKKSCASGSPAMQVETRPPQPNVTDLPNSSMYCFRRG